MVAHHAFAKYFERALAVWLPRGDAVMSRRRPSRRRGTGAGRPVLSALAPQLLVVDRSADTLVTDATPATDA
jgi:hypothetical protein